ncbi:MAG: galactitol-1-phosphate 5-dehydrogenase [Deltaproteobacteria bacterium RBG_16_48_10]|nr:MAG: galactitol-1-phosphate 5-dehydrogenase [Deltaproteobacteria bacterium RBG_16_48_10]
MKALVLSEYNHFEYREVPEPRPTADEVLIEVKACGICGSDIHGMDGSTGRRQPPIIMGHEASGIIVGVGSEAANWTPGDRVTFDSTISCGQCPFCHQGRPNLCDNRRVFGVSCDEYRQHGAFAQYVAVPQQILYRLPEGLSFERTAVMEPLSIALHALNRTAVKIGDTAVVVGTGMIGLLLVQALRISGCGRILAIDLDPFRLEMACRLGADEGLNAGQANSVKEVIKRTGHGADIVFEAVGISDTVQTAIGCVRKGGQLTLVGNILPKVEFPLQAVVTRELTLSASCGSSGEYPVCLDLLSRGVVNVDPLISVVAPLAEGARWFQALYRGESGLLKVILRP